MFRRPCLRLRRQSVSLASQTSPLEVLDLVQSGANVPALALRHYITRYFAEEILRRGLSEARIATLDTRSLQELLRSLMFEQYVAVPFTPFAFDFEFTGLPGSGSDDAASDPSIIEIGIYAPDSGASFSSLVRPFPGTKLSEEAAALTKISPADLETAQPFERVWEDALSFMRLQAASPEASRRLLMLSHGQRFADLRLLDVHLARTSNKLPPEIRFGDTYTAIRELHRRRPVTKDKFPPSWALSELALWLELDMPDTLHRALPDAKLTWDVMFHTLDRYGDSGLSPREQLVLRYFAVEGEDRIAGLAAGGGGSSSSSRATGRVAATAAPSSLLQQQGSSASDDLMTDMSEDGDGDFA